MEEKKMQWSHKSIEHRQIVREYDSTSSEENNEMAKGAFLNLKKKQNNQQSY